MTGEGRRARSARAGWPAAAAPVFAALGDETRLKIVSRLSGVGPTSTVRLTDVAAVSRQAIAKHLVALQRAGLVGSRRVGRERRWALRPARLAEVRAYLERISLDWDLALGRLKMMVEGREA